MKHCEVNQQSHNFLRTFHVIYIDCVAVSTSTSCCKQLSPPCLHPSAYSYKECLLFTKRLTALTFSPRPPLTHVEFLCGLLYCISFRSDMYLQRRSTKLEWIRLSVQQLSVLSTNTTQLVSPPAGIQLDSNPICRPPTESIWRHNKNRAFLAFQAQSLRGKCGDFWDIIGVRTQAIKESKV